MNENFIIFNVAMMLVTIGGLYGQTTTQCDCSLQSGRCLGLKVAVDALRGAADAAKLAAQEFEAAAQEASDDPEAAAALREAARESRLVALVAHADAKALGISCDLETCCRQCCSSIYSNLDSIYDPNTPAFNLSLIRLSPLGCGSNSGNQTQG